MTGPQSEKETIHIELELEEGMTYLPGDAVGIIPTNRESQVAECLKALGWTGDERVLDLPRIPSAGGEVEIPVLTPQRRDPDLTKQKVRGFSVLLDGRRRRL